ncbi:bifunctional diguanylate cyclase/phosphodiesterase [Sulfurovum sp. NBC37-1]|uniref:bifunctional diguanylate cyclase/phosphodiesterase n=1 Tax=Sulfurovum sp. (strain NBC37-1) TaxID=387093 RepID=UPI00015875B9|nr:EAL domain-containing protein [Sulfurovum sp. NBC37-1]BAF72147.1 conserved hypothetical protein [Sulfurovum sp. NBC37-1]
MRTVNTYYTDKQHFQEFVLQVDIADNDQLLIQVFTSYTDKTKIEVMTNEITSLFPRAVIIGATTDGEICSGKVTTHTHVISLTQFEDTVLYPVCVDADGKMDSHETGQTLAEAVTSQEDKKVLIAFLDGTKSNGEEFLRGIDAVCPELTVAGGMAGDYAEFKNTYVFTGEQIISRGAVGVALSNPKLHIYTKYNFNWKPIGRSLVVTKVDRNRVYTIDDMSAYDVYKKYFGEEVAQKLPAIGIEFPLIIKKGGDLTARAILSVHEDGSLSFSGNFHQGDTVYFGYGDAKMLLDQSEQIGQDIVSQPVECIFIYSCMARRRFLPELIEQETKPLQSVAPVSGFFTYGEFFSFSGKKALLNQTMTILGLSESSHKTDKKIVKQKIVLNEYQASAKALSHFINVNMQEAQKEFQKLEEKTRVIEAQKEALHRIQQIGHFGSWEIDLKHNTAQWSKRSYDIYQLDPENTQPTLDTFLSRVVKKDRHIAYEGLRSLQDGKVKSVSLRVRREDGEIITVLINAKMLFDKQGEPDRIVGTTLDITEQLRLKQENKELGDIIEYASGEVLIVELGTFRYLYANDAAIRKLGYTREEICRLSILDINREITHKQLREFEKEIRANGTVLNRTVYTKKDDSKYPVQTYAQYGKYHNRDAMIIFNLDISHLVAIEKKEIEQAQILEQIHDAVISTDLDNKIIHWNHGATELLGYDASEMIGRNIDILYPEDELKKAQWMKMQTLLYGSYRDQIRKQTKEGKMIYTDVSASVLRDEKKRIIGITRYSQDISQKKEIELELLEQTKQLNFQAYHDPLTQLPNRTLFNDRLEQTITYAHRHNEKFGVFFIDLDNFKLINDTLGHHLGDEVLKIVSHRFSKCIREEDTLSRLGGDEFTVLVHELNTPESAAKIAGKMMGSLKEEVVVEGQTLHVTASIGISLYPRDAVYKNDLLKYADSAMYKAKEVGRNNYQFYSSEMTNLAMEKATMEKELRKAIAKNQLRVYYQPQINARNRSVVGLEALVRWEHPEKGLILPDAFIPLAEETGLIREMDYYVMHQAMSDMVEWYHIGLNPGILSLNLPISQLMKENFFYTLQNTILKTGFKVKWLTFEITETQVMLNPKHSIKKLYMLNQMGIKISIDDFGTGYSSLAYLKRLPVDKLKIDKTFIFDLPYNTEDCAITNAVIALAESLHLEIIAEGVEHRDQVRYLLENGCYIIQGYHYSRPIPKQEMTQYLMR